MLNAQRLRSRLSGRDESGSVMVAILVITIVSMVLVTLLASVSNDLGRAQADDERSKAFTARFSEGAKAAGYVRHLPHHTDASAYDVVHFMAQAMRRANVTGEPARRAAERTAIRDQLLAMQSWNFTGVLGRIWFESDNSARLPAHVIEVRDGGLHLLASKYEG